MKLRNEITFQNYNEKVITVVGSRQGQKDIWRWAVASSIGEHIFFRDLRPEIYIPTEEKISVDGANGVNSSK